MELKTIHAVNAKVGMVLGGHTLIDIEAVE